MTCYCRPTSRMVRASAAFTVLACALGASMFPVGTRVLHASTPPALVLNLRLTSTQTLPATSVASLMAEASAIWSEGHIRLNWQTDGGEVDEASFLRVLFLSRAVPAAGESSGWAVGELVRMEGARALAIASITGARRIVEEARLPTLDLP